MPVEKMYCGNCGSPLYYGANFRTHASIRPCPECQTLNPLSFRYCYRCGFLIIARETEDDSEIITNPS